MSNLAAFVSGREFNKILDYKPYQWQRDMHAAGVDNPERLLMAANGVGKCVSFQTLIDTTSGLVSAGELYNRGKPFEVWAWDGSAVVAATASAPFKKKGLHQCYRLYLKNGRWVECADHHRVLLDGAFSFVGPLLESARVPLASTLGISLSVHGVNGPHWTQTPSSSLAGCRSGRRSRDEQPLSGQESGQGFPPSLAGAVQRIAAWWCEGGQGSRYTNTLQSSFALPSNTGVLPLYESQENLSQDRVSWTSDEPSSLTPQGYQQSSTVGVHRRTVDVNQREELRAVASISAPGDLLFNSDDIIAYDAIGAREVYDFSVERWHNYIAGGVVHHNTYPGSIETSYHLTGNYPDWWEGIRFDFPPVVWAGTIDNDFQTENNQLMLLGPGLTAAELGTGMIPRDKIVGKPSTRQAGISDVVDVVKVRHVSGGLSQLKFKTYEQGWKKWQGRAPNFIWLDEQPDENNVKEKPIYAEVQTRIFRSHGAVLLTLTPLLGETEMIRHFMYPLAEGIHITGATWDDAPHLMEEDKERLRKTYPSYQVDARTKGVPMMGEGAVFGVDERDFVIDPFEIPNHFRRICGIDFGWDHPAACAWLDYDADKDTVYLTDTWRMRNAGYVAHASAIKQRGAWIPVAWPHDGLTKKDQGSQKALPLWHLYRREGVNMLPMTARYEKEVGGPQPVEPMIDTMLERLQSGGFKVFRNCTHWLEEYRSYHRKDGRIVPLRDDALKASFYAMMQLRSAKRKPTGQAQRRPMRPIVTMA